VACGRIVVLSIYSGILLQLKLTRHDITDILLQVVFNTNKSYPKDLHLVHFNNDIVLKLDLSKQNTKLTGILSKLNSQFNIIGRYLFIFNLGELNPVYPGQNCW